MFSANQTHCLGFPVVTGPCHSESSWVSSPGKAWTPGWRAMSAPRTHPCCACFWTARKPSAQTTCGVSHKRSWRGRIASWAPPPRQWRLHACPPQTLPTNLRSERGSLPPWQSSFRHAHGLAAVFVDHLVWTNWIQVHAPVLNLPSSLVCKIPGNEGCINCKIAGLFFFNLKVFIKE